MEKIRDQKEGPRGAAGGHRLLSVYRESWREDYKFFSARDLELCVKGLCEGTFELVELELGDDLIRASAGGKSEIVLRRCRWNEAGSRTLEQRHAPARAMSWLAQAAEDGLSEEPDGWKDVTDAVNT